MTDYVKVKKHLTKFERKNYIEIQRKLYIEYVVAIVLISLICLQFQALF